MKKIGIVLEGGGMRGIYTAGVLDFFINKNIYFPYVIGVSAGACHGLNYLSRQKGRDKDIALKFLGDKRYLSFRNLIRTGEIFGFDFIFGELSKKLLPFDYEAFENSKQELAVGVTNCITGQCEYFYKSKTSTDEFLKAVRASSSLPFISKEVIINGKAYMDGGISSSIPLKKSIDDGYEYNIVVLTRNKGYRKKPSKLTRKLSKLKYRNFRGLSKAVGERYKKYNSELEFVENMEKEGKVFVIRPQKHIKVSRVEKDKNKIFQLYKQGYIETAKTYKDLKKWINSIDN